ncbi:MAG: hypothetical protein ICV83_01275 [Cytophagales bacterium]|nr:hypothetical protein [Cytophagales bacterium]
MIENSKNVIAGSIDAGGIVTVGDTFVINLKEAAQYKALLAALARLDQQMEKTRERIARFVEDKDLKEEYEVELLQLSEERNEKQKELDTLKWEVLKLAEEFCRIPINTQRLEQARKHFQAGEFTEARAVLDAEMMGNELDDAIRKEEVGKQLQSQARKERTKLANEYLILARLTAIDFNRPDRFEKTKAYFEQSLKAERNVENLSAFAVFLQMHQQFDSVERLYEEALAQYRTLAEDSPRVYLPGVATTFNNLGLLLM